MDLIRTLLGSVTPGDTILDIGANVGGYTHLFRHACPDTTIHAFEPIPSVYATLAARYTDDPAIYCWHLGVGARCEILTGVAVHEAWTINRPGETPRGRNATYGGDTFDMTLTTVDAFLLKWPTAHVTAIKIDTDGYDARVLRGAQETITRDRPRILIEFGYCLIDLGDSTAALIDGIETLGYRIHDEHGTVLEARRWREWYPFHTTADYLLMPAEQPVSLAE